MRVAVSALAAMVAVLLIFYYGGIIGNHVQANYNKRVVTSKVQQQVRTPVFAQAVYEQFFQDCNSVVADNQKIEIAKQRVADVKAQSDDTFGTKAGKVSDAEADLAGIEQIQADTAASYNANAAEYTRGQFRDSNLPAQINPPYEEIRCQ